MAFLVGLVSCLSAVFPSVPSLEPSLAAANEALARRWSCLGQYGAGQHGGVLWAPRPWAVGVAMLMPIEIAFSQWFFFLALKVVQVLTLTWGWDTAPDAPFPYQQSAGALMAVGAYAVWAARRHLLRAVREALRPREWTDGPREPLRYRSALGLLTASIAVLCLLVLRAGAPYWLVPLYLALYLTASIALSRIRAEVGGPANVVHSVAPSEMLTQLVTPGAFPVRALTALTLLGWTSLNHGADPTSFQMEGFKIAERSGLHPRGLVGAMVLAAALGLALGYGMLLGPLYRLGVDSAYLQFPTKGRAAFSTLQTWLSGVAPATGSRGVAMGAGFFLVLFLYQMQARLIWWPLNPVGYVLAPMWFTHHLWLSIFIAWLAKLLLLRYGGLRGYRAALPFFLGLVLGDCVIGGLWFVASSLFSLPKFGVWL